MKLPISNISVRSRFFLFATVTILFWLLAGFLVYSMIAKLTRIQDTALKVHLLSRNVHEMEIAVNGFCNSESHSREFLESGSSVSIGRFNEIYPAAYNLLGELQFDRFVASSAVLSRRAELIQDYCADADRIFQSLVTTLRKRGEGTYGLSGSILKLLDEPGSGTAENYGESGGALASELREYIAAPDGSRMMVIRRLLDGLMSFTGDREEVTTLAAAVENLLRIDQEAGLSRHEGLQYQLYRVIGILKDESVAMIRLFDVEAQRSVRGIHAGLIILIILSVMIYTAIILWLRYSVIQPLKVVDRQTTELSLGRLPTTLAASGTNEFGRIFFHLDTFIRSLKAKARFAEDLAGDKEMERLEPLSEEDLLANALIKMEKKIRAAKVEDQKYRQSRDERRWANEGIAKFGEILRMNNDINALAENVIQELVAYLGASAGGFYLTSEEEHGVFLNLVAAFAFNRKKFLKRKIEFGEGLVGTCAIEKEKIVLTEIPEDYVNVSSGLGEGKPRSLIIIPLKYEEVVLGVIEIASIKILKEHELAFIENLAESIASAVSAVQLNMRTAELLKQSREQAREMAKQEEIMRQQMEELQTTQEESSRRESEISGILNAIHNSSLVAEYNMDEELISINDKFTQLLESQQTQLHGRKHHEITGTSKYTEAHVKFWEEIRQGRTISQVEKITVPSGEEIWLRQTFTPILDKDGVLIKVLNIASDITETIQQQQSLEEQAVEITRANIELRTLGDAVDSALIKCAYSPAGQILEVNENFENATGYTSKELVGKNNRIFLQRVEKEQFDKIWEDVQKNKPYRGVIRRTKPTGEEIWLMSSFTPVQDEQGNIFKVFFLGQDITERKLKYQLLEEANKEIERMRRQLDERG